MLYVRFEKPAERYIEKLKDSILLKRILNKIEKLKETPFPSEAVRVEGYNKDKVFRVRVGDHRLLYYVNYDKSVIVVIAIDRRERVY